MPEPLDQIRAAIPCDVLARLVLIHALIEEDHVPELERPAHVERPRDIHRAVRLLHWLVIRSGPTPAARSRPPFGFAPSLTGLSGSQARRRSPGSRACCFSTCAGSSTTPRPAQARDMSPAADVAFHLCKQGRHAVRQFSGLNRPAHRCLYLRFAVRLATHHAKLKVRIESLLLFCRALSSPATCRFIPAHSHPFVALSSYEAFRL